jgi:hypothetical protein
MASEHTPYVYFTLRGFAAPVAPLNIVLTVPDWNITLQVLHYVSVCKWYIFRFGVFPQLGRFLVSHYCDTVTGKRTKNTF